MIRLSFCSPKRAYLPSVARVLRIKRKKRRRRSISTAARIGIKIKTRTRKRRRIRIKTRRRIKTEIGAKERMARESIRRRYLFPYHVFGCI